MPYCSRCGVEVSEAVEACPLCATPIQKLDGQPRAPEPKLRPYPLNAVDEGIVESMDDRQKSMLAWEIATVSIGIAAGILFLVDALVDGFISWAYIPAASLGALWIGLTAILLLGKRLVLKLAICAADILAFIAALDLQDGSIGWLLPYGLPMAGTFFLSVAVATALTMASKKKGINVAAYILLGITLMSIGVDTVLQVNSGSFLKPSWSLVVSLALLPVVAFLIYLHYRFTKKISLKKVFHR